MHTTYKTPIYTFYIFHISINTINTTSEIKKRVDCTNASPQYNSKLKSINPLDITNKWQVLSCINWCSNQARFRHTYLNHTLNNKKLNLFPSPILKPELNSHSKPKPQTCCKLTTCYWRFAKTKIISYSTNKEKL